MTIGPRSQCSTCARFVSPWASPNYRATCAAFPQGIPQAVLDNTLDHREPVDGDNGIRWLSDGRAHPLDDDTTEPDEEYDDGMDMDEDKMPPSMQARDRELALLGVTRSTPDVVPNDEVFKRYWTTGKGLRKWLGHPHEWTTLRNHLLKYVGPERADRIAAEWFHLVKGFWPGSDLHRVEHGKPPRGKVVGPG
jgi:hypothetical protein